MKYTFFISQRCGKGTGEDFQVEQCCYAVTSMQCVDYILTPSCKESITV